MSATLFVKTRMSRDSVAEGQRYVNYLFFASFFMVVNGFSELPITVCFLLHLSPWSNSDAELAVSLAIASGLALPEAPMLADLILSACFCPFSATLLPGILASCARTTSPLNHMLNDFCIMLSGRPCCFKLVVHHSYLTSN